MFDGEGRMDSIASPLFLIGKLPRSNDMRINAGVYAIEMLFWTREDTDTQRACLSEYVFSTPSQTLSKYSTKHAIDCRNSVTFSKLLLEL